MGKAGPRGGRAILRQRKQYSLRRQAAEVIARGRQRLGGDVGEIAGTALQAALIAGLPITVGLALLSTIQFGPPVGEILTFGPYAQPGPVWHIAVVRSADQRHCILQPAIMALAPGSLVVEARSADGRRFQAHWAGGPTSKPATDCGGNVDLTISLSAIQTLVNADELGHPHWHFAPP